MPISVTKVKNHSGASDGLFDQVELVGDITVVTRECINETGYA